MAYLGKIEYDDFVLDCPIVDAGTIKGTDAASMKRGTLLSLGSDGKLVPATSSAAPNCILAEDVEVEASTDAKCAVYVAGVFNVNKLILSEGYTITAAHKEGLRDKGIFLKAAQKM